MNAGGVLNTCKSSEKLNSETLKEAIRAIILYKSEVGENDNVVDIGCGTGGICSK